VSELWAKFILEFSAPNAFAARSRTQRVTRLKITNKSTNQSNCLDKIGEHYQHYLDHELFDDPMETVTVVVTIARMHTEILHRLRTFLKNLCNNFINR
jgi:hypothetical protein